MTVKNRNVHSNKYILGAALFVLSIYLVFLLISSQVTHTSQSRSFDTLGPYARQMAREIRRDAESDLKQMEHVAQMISDQDLSEREGLKLLDGGMMVFDPVVWYPDGRTLQADGGGSAVFPELTFEEEAEKGPHLSGLTKDGQETVWCSFVPVVKDGETCVLLAGLADQERMKELYQIDAFSGGVQSYLVEGKSGRFLMGARKAEETIHSFESYKVKKGYQMEQMLADIEAGRSGQIIFYSPGDSTWMYSNYEPVGINDWMLMLALPEDAALAGTRRIRGIFYLLAGLEALILAVYFMWLINARVQEAKKKEHELSRAQYILSIEKILFDTPRDPELIVAALEKIAEVLTAKETFFLINKPGEKRLFLWADDKTKKRQKWDDGPLLNAFPRLYEKLIEEGQIISYDLSGLKQELAEEFGLMKDYGVQSLMMIPVKNLKEEPVGILGALDMKEEWKTAEPLDSVMLSFSMALNNIESFRTIKRMGMMDELTGVWNRNRYQLMVETYEKGGDRSLACVYVDADGLHEFNNQYGHMSGDQMLKTIAEILKSEFGPEEVYRIGGDEFVVFCLGMNQEQVCRRIRNLEKQVIESGYHVSVGVEYRSTCPLVYEMVKRAEEKMYEAKHRYYERQDVNLQSREMNRQLEATLMEKRDLDTFREILSSKYLGVYILNPATDTMRCIYIPPYFERIFQEAGGKYSLAVKQYMMEFVRPEYHTEFLKVLDYDWLEERLRAGKEPTVRFQKTNGEYLLLKIHRYPDETGQSRESVWFFEKTNRRDLAMWEEI